MCFSAESLTRRGLCHGALAKWSLQKIDGGLLLVQYEVLPGEGDLAGQAHDVDMDEHMAR